MNVVVCFSSLCQVIRSARNDCPSVSWCLMSVAIVVVSSLDISEYRVRDVDISHICHAVCLC